MSDIFQYSETIEINKLFEPVTSLLQPSTVKIEEIEFPENWELDIRERPLMIKDQIPQRMSFRMEKLIIGESSNKRENQKRLNKDKTPIVINQPTCSVIGRNKETNYHNYEIQGNMFDGIKLRKIKLLIDTGSANSYISSYLVENLEKIKLREPHYFGTINSSKNKVEECIEIEFEIRGIKINYDFFIRKDMHESLEIICGTDFLKEKCRPYSIREENMDIHLHGKTYTIERKYI